MSLRRARPKADGRGAEAGTRPWHGAPCGRTPRPSQRGGNEARQRRGPQHVLRLPCAVRVLRLRAPCTERCGFASSSDASSGRPLLLRLLGVLQAGEGDAHYYARLALRCGL